MLRPRSQATGTSTPAYEPAGVVAGLQLHILEPPKADFWTPAHLAPAQMPQSSRTAELTGELSGDQEMKSHS